MNLTTPIAGEGQEIDELAVLHAAMLPEIGKFRRPHEITHNQDQIEAREQRINAELQIHKP